MQELKSRHYPISEDMGFQRTSWIVERGGWIVLTLLLLAALLGLFGHGPVSKVSVHDPALQVDYDRFQRITKVTAYLLHLKGGGEPKLTFGPRFQTGYEVVDIEPRPVHSSAGDKSLELQFASHEDSLRVVVWVKPRAFGRMRFTVSSGGEPLTVRAFIYP
jgi:hypothetical protein